MLLLKVERSQFMTNMIFPPKLWEIPTRGRDICSRQWLVIRKRSHAKSIHVSGKLLDLWWVSRMKRWPYTIHTELILIFAPTLSHEYRSQQLVPTARPTAAHTVPMSKPYAYHMRYRVKERAIFNTPTPWAAMKVIVSAATGPSCLGVDLLQLPLDWPITH